MYDFVKNALPPDSTVQHAIPSSVAMLPVDTQVLNHEQFETYLSMKNVAVGDNVLEFWRDNENLFPDLAILARKFVTPPGSTASVEATFSELKIMLNDRRLGLNPENISKMLVSRSLMKLEEAGFMT